MLLAGLLSRGGPVAAHQPVLNYTLAVPRSRKSIQPNDVVFTAIPRPGMMAGIAKMSYSGSLNTVTVRAWGGQFCPRPARPPKRQPAAKIGRPTIRQLASELLTWDA